MSEPETPAAADDAPRVAVLFEGDDPTLTALAQALGPAVPLERAELALVLDDRSVAAAREAGVRAVAISPSFVPPFRQGLEGVERVVLPHRAAGTGAVAAGARVDAIEVLGPLAPAGLAIPEDRAAARAALEVGDAPLVVVEAAALTEGDLTQTLVQLSLVRREATWAFAVGRDPELTRHLRRQVPGYGLDAHVFADVDGEGVGASQVLAGADLVLGALDGPFLLRGAAVGAGLVALPPRREAYAAAQILEEDGVVEVADSLPTLSVTLDRSLAQRDALQTESAKLDAVGAVLRVKELVADVLAGRAARRGLPVGLERISSADDARRVPAAPDGDAPAADGGGVLDERVDDELARLRDKLGL
jgi:hypothetical protein